MKNISLYLDFFWQTRGHALCIIEIGARAPARI